MANIVKNGVHSRMTSIYRLETARKELKSACAGFNCRYFVEHEKRDGCLELTRHDVYELNEGGFEVVKTKCVVGSVNGRLEKELLGRFTHLHLAKDAVESSVTVLEQDGSCFIDEKTFELHDVMAEKHLIPVHVVDIPAGKELEYLGEGIVYAQKITQGFRLFVTINPFGKILVHASCKDNSVWEEASAPIRSRLECLTRVEGARGAVLEIVMSGASIDVIDVWFLHNKWLNDLSMIERHNLFRDYCKANNLSLNVLSGTRARVSAVSCLAVDSIKALLVEKGGLRYVVKRHGWEMLVNNGYKHDVRMVNLNSMGPVGHVNGHYLPQILYKSFSAAGQGVESFWY